MVCVCCIRISVEEWMGRGEAIFLQSCLAVKDIILVSTATVTNYHELGIWREMYSLTVVQGRSLKSRCWRGLLPQTLLGKISPFFCLLSTCCGPAVLGVLWLVPSASKVCLWWHRVTWPSSLCACLCVSSHSLHLESTWISYDLILINDICKDPISKEGHLLRFQVEVNFGLCNPVQMTFVLCSKAHLLQFTDTLLICGINQLKHAWLDNEILIKP